MPIDYHRPSTLAEAVALLGKARPLAGGTSLIPHRRTIRAVADLQALDLDRIARKAGWVELGSCVQLQAIVEEPQWLPEAMRRSAAQEAGWNIRNAATLGGTIASGDGRSPLLVCLLALQAEVLLEPGGNWHSIDGLLAGRPGSLEAKLMTSIRLGDSSQSAYEQVGRTPADWPIVAAAACVSGDAIEVALGGFGERPVRVRSTEGEKGFAAAAAAAFSAASDDWASAAYRSAVAAILAGRVVEKLARR